MMKKEYIQRSEFQEVFVSTFDEFLKKMEIFKVKYKNGKNFKIDSDYLVFSCDELETDKEHAERIKEELRFLEEINKADYEQYLRLKKKFEGKE